MTPEPTKQLLDDLEQRFFQKLRDRAGAWPETCRQELEAELQEISQDLAAWREAGPAPEPHDPSSPGTADDATHFQTILSQIFAAIPDLLTVVDRDFNVVMSNWHGVDFIPEEERRGQPKCYRAYVRRESPCEPCQAQEVFATGKPCAREWVSPITGRFWEIHALPILDESGQVVMVAEDLRDITERHRAQEALRQSEARFRAIFEHAPVGISMTDLAGRILQTNRVLQALLGYTAEELRGRDSSEIIHPEDQPESARLGLELLAGNQRHFSTNSRLLRKDGELVWGHVTVTLLRDVRGEPEYFVGTVLDITAQKQAEEELRKSEKRFRLLAETIQDVFWIATPDMRQVTYLSPGYVQVWGRPREQLYQKYRSFRESIHPEDRERVLSEMVKGREREAPWSQEYRIIKPGGEVRWIQDRGFPVRDDHNHLIMFTGVATDITERKALEQQLLQAQKMEVAGRLAGGVAHDFNNLIMAIMGYVELMGAKVLKGDPLHGYLEEIQKATDRAAGLTRQLLTFSRQQIMKPQVIDLNRVVLDLKKMLERVLGEDVDLEIMTDSGTAPVKADPGHLTQILMNLVVNARDAMPRGGQITVETAKVDFKESRHTRFAVASPGPYVRLTVRDTGLGMDEETRTHIFEPFFTTKEPGKGTGLGLSTVYGIVKQSQGYIDLESEPGVGSVFTIYLPRLEAAVQVPKSAKPITERLRGSETILLVEDEDVLRTLLGKFLRLCGYTVLEARHGGEALLLCERYQGKIHLMVTDVVMPQMSGRELADRLLPLHPEMKVLFMSGYTEDAVVHHGVAYLSMPFLQKPFKPIQLVQKIQAILNLPAESFVSE
ncbi:MAG: PAS domain S-box protein [Syntrophobacterales bacterium]|nr:PAS domain S-box protein [Syntrophobacterales bacterium]